MIVNKVEICGVNTSKLPVLKEKEKRELLLKMRSGDTQARETFIKGNLRLVLSVIQRFNNRGENVDDLFQVGCIGLMKSIDNFDLSQNVKFSTYAVPMIIGEVKRFLRDNSAFRVTRSIRDLAYQIAQEKENYVLKYNEEPTVEKICEIVNASKEDVILAIDSMATPMSIYDSVYNDGGDQIYLLDQLKNDKEEAEGLVNSIAINQMLQELTDKERSIIEKRYFKEVTQTELAEELGVSQAQISRIEKNAFKKIKTKYGNTL